MYEKCINIELFFQDFYIDGISIRPTEKKQTEWIALNVRSTRPDNLIIAFVRFI